MALSDSPPLTPVVDPDIVETPLPDSPPSSLESDDDFVLHKVSSDTISPAIISDRKEKVLYPMSGGSYDPRVYASGRWLLNDQFQRDIRYIEFNFAQLRARVCEIKPSAGSIRSCTANEGGFNRLFIFTFNDDSRIVARLPFRICGPPKLTIASEVATITYLQSSTTIPIPKILDWRDTKDNPIGAEYIIMEHANGNLLHDVWPDLSLLQRVHVTAALLQTTIQAAKVKADAYGSIYFDTIELPEDLKQPFSPGFVIGPESDSLYWNCDPREPKYYVPSEPNRGPWLTVSDYCSALIDVGLSRLPHPDNNDQQRRRGRGSAADHSHLLAIARQMMPIMLKDSKFREASAAVLMHQDLDARNIFVSAEDPTVITAVIDWQSCSIRPAFMYSNPQSPDFVLGRTGVFADNSVDDPKHLCEQAYFTVQISAAFFRRLLIDLFKDLERHPDLQALLSKDMTLEDDDAHKEDCYAVEVELKLRDKVAEMTGAQTDGWVPAEYWDDAQQCHQELYECYAENVGKETADDFWPFEIPQLLPSTTVEVEEVDRHSDVKETQSSDGVAS